MLERVSPKHAPGLRAVLLNERGMMYRRLAVGNQAAQVATAIASYEEALQLIAPESGPLEYATIQANLGNAYSDLRAGDRTANLARAIACYEEALRFRGPETAPIKYGETQHHLGLVYMDLPTGERAKNLGQAIACFHEALRFCSSEAVGAVAYARIHTDLGDAYSALQRWDGGATLRQAIASYEEALRVSNPDDGPLWYGMTLNSLGKAYAQLLTGDKASQVAKAIDCYQQALRFITPESDAFEYADTQSNMGIAYRNLPTGNIGVNLAKAIACHTEALRFWTPQSAPRDYARTQHNLGNVYIQLPTGERAANLATAIACFEEALRFRTPQEGGLQYARTQMALGGAWLELSTGDRSATMANAIAGMQEALRFLTPEIAPLEYALAQNNLGVAFRELPSGDRAANLAKAIACFHDALRFRTLEAAPRDYAMTQANLGGAYSMLPTGDPAENFGRAIACYESALRIYTPEAAPFDYALVQMNMGIAYAQLPTADQAANIRQAINCYEQALLFFTRDAAPLNYAMVHQNLGIAYRLLPTGDRPINLARAIASFQQVLSMRSPETDPLGYARAHHNLGGAYADLHTGDRASNLAKAIDCYEQALRFRALDVVPLDRALTLYSLGSVHFDEERWGPAYAAFDGALAAMDAVYLTAATDASRQVELAAAPHLVVNAAYCLARLGRPTEAVERLEAGRTRALAEAVARERAALDQATPADRAAFVAGRERIRKLEAEGRLSDPDPTRAPVARNTTQLFRVIDRIVEQATGSPQRPFGTVSAELHEARVELATVAARIRAYVPDFVPTTPHFTAVADAAAPGQPLVYLVTTRHGSLALVVPAEASALGPEHAIRLDGFCLDDLAVLLFGGGTQPGYVAAQVTGDPALLATVLDRVLPVLRDRLIGPAAQHLRELGFDRATLIPTGRLSLLPLHAPILDTLTVSYAPSGVALKSARASAAERSHLPPALLAVGNPLPHPNPLIFARAEVEAVAALYGRESRRLFLEHEATRTRILHELPGATNVHFACHGAFDVDEPLHSAVYFAGEHALTLRELLDGELDLSAIRLVVLSACQTGMTDFRRVPDEAVGLAAGFLRAGVPVVLSTLWEVADLSTALLIERFYQYHLQDGLDAASALRKAQLWLRNATVREMDLVQRYQTLFEASDRRDLDLLDAVRFYRANPDMSPFAHPYYWACFIVSGAATAETSPGAPGYVLTKYA
jgi:CHAT domain-containing protein/tetratricopeptide (TPR) repeat protein